MRVPIGMRTSSRFPCGLASKSTCKGQPEKNTHPSMCCVGCVVHAQAHTHTHPTHEVGGMIGECYVIIFYIAFRCGMHPICFNWRFNGPTRLFFGQDNAEYGLGQARASFGHVERQVAQSVKRQLFSGSESVDLQDTKDCNVCKRLNIGTGGSLISHTNTRLA